MGGLIDTWKGLSRAMQWAILALIAFALYFYPIEPLINWTSGLNAQANKYQDDLEALQSQAENRSKAIARLSDSARLFGEVTPPGPLNERVSEVRQNILSVLSDNDAQEVEISNNPGKSLGRNRLTEFIDDPEKQEIQRAAFDVSFTSTPERVTEIIGAIERIPEITLIAEINLTRVDSRGARLVNVSMSPEVWGIATKGSR